MKSSQEGHKREAVRIQDNFCSFPVVLPVHESLLEYLDRAALRYNIHGKHSIFKLLTLR